MKKIILIIAFFFLITSKFTAQVKDISFTFSPASEYTWWDNNAGFKDGENGYFVEVEQFGKCFGTEDFSEGTTAFLEKRKANFPGK